CPVHDDRRRGGNLHGADAEFDVVILVDRVVVVRCVGVEPNWLTRQHHLESVSWCAALWAVRRADPDDGEWNSKLLRNPAAHGLRGDLGETVVRPQRYAGPVRFGQRAAALVAVDRSGRAQHET